MKKEKTIWIKSREYIDAVGISRQRLSQLIHGIYKPDGYFVKPKFREGIDYKWVGKRLFVNKELVERKKQ